MSVSPKSLNFRKIQVEDLPEVMAIERQCYEFPWTEEIFKSCFNAGNLAMFAELEGKAIGYGILSTVLDEASLLNICIAPSEQGKGYAKVLLQFLCEQVRALGADTLFLEVRASNQAALHLYENMGFNQIGTRRNYYPAKKGREDAWMFALSL
jgi:ribosomal-protein-alanine N-acetyltransferase